MTKLKVRGFGQQASDAVEPHIRNLYANPAGKVLFVGELEHVERTVPGPASEAEPTVTARIAELEIPGAQHQDVLRDVMRGLWLLRTVPGTFDEASASFQVDEAQAKIAGSASLILAGDALDARWLLRQVREHLSMLSVANLDQRKLQRKLSDLHDMVNAFLQTGSRASEQETLDLRTSTGVWTSEGRVDDRTGELVGQDVGTRVPAPAVPDDDGPVDPSEPRVPAPEFTPPEPAAQS